MRMLIGGVIFWGLALMDFLKMDCAVKETYRDLPGRKKWQRKKAIYEALIGVVAIAVFALEREQITCVPLNVSVIGIVVLAGWNNHRFYKEGKNK